MNTLKMKPTLTLLTAGFMLAATATEVTAQLAAEYTFEPGTALPKLSGDGTQTTVKKPVRAGVGASCNQIDNTQERKEFILAPSGSIKVKSDTIWAGMSYYNPSAANAQAIIWQIGPLGSSRQRQRFDLRGGNPVGSDLIMQENPPAMKMRLNRQTGTEAGKIVMESKEWTWSIPEDQWVDVVVNANFAGPADGTGFFKLWTRVAGGEWVQRVDYTGSTMVNQSEFPACGEMKCGLYVGNPGKGARTLYVDELRWGKASAGVGFEQVAPRLSQDAKPGREQTAKP